MKKTLALILALLMLASFALVACNDNEKTPVNDDDYEDDDNIKDDEDKDTEKDTEADTEDDTEKDTEKESENQTENNVPEWETKNDTVYVGVDGLNLRSAPNASPDSVVAQVNAGTALTRIATNGTYDKVKNPTTNEECYVLSKWVTTVGSNFEFTAVDPATDLEFSTASDAKNACFFTTPHVAWNGDDYDYTNIVCKAGIKHGNLSEGYTLKKIGYNANWIKVEFVGTITITNGATITCTAEDPGIFYVRKVSIGDKCIIDKDASSSTQTPGGIG